MSIPDQALPHLTEFGNALKQTIKLLECFLV
jgi:hypothetical protein